MKLAAIIPSFNDSHTAQIAIEALLRQDLPAQCTFEIVFVDDGSTDDGAQKISRRFGSAVRVVAQPKNLGRSRARNAGAWATPADTLLFLDADCVPAGSCFVREHVHAILRGADVVFGELATETDSQFWSRMQQMAIRARRKRFSAGEFWAPTSANFVVRASRFRSCGGFDEQMRGYGFEDRDLFLRLGASGASFSFCDAAIAVHHGTVNLPSLRRKHYQAGASNASLFRERHPEAYRQMTLSRFDATLHPYLQRLAPCFNLALRPFERSAERWTQADWLPFKARAMLVQLLYGCAFLQGTLSQATCKDGSGSNL